MEYVFKVCRDPKTGQGVFKKVLASQIEDDEIDWKEKELIQEHIRTLFDFPKTDDSYNKKLSTTIKCTKDALKLYGHPKAIHYDRAHIKIMAHLDEGMLFAPNGEYLEMFMTRSSFFYHTNKFEECLKDCERGLKMDGIDVTQTLMLGLFACACHTLLNKPMVGEMRDKLVNLLNTLRENKNREDNVVKKQIEDFLGREIVPVVKEENPAEQEYTGMEYLHFERHEKISFASKSIELIKKENGEMQVIALKDIEPGEIIFVEKRLGVYGHINYTMFCLCVYCHKQSWDRISCCYCSTAMYCSEKCRSNDWETYHKWICRLTPIKFITYGGFLNFFFEMVDEAGGMKHLAKYLQEDINIKSAYETSEYTKLKHVWDVSHIEQFEKLPNLQNHIDYCCQTAYLLATKTNFLGKKFKQCMFTMHENEIVFLATAMLRSYIIHQNLKFYYFAYKSGFTEKDLMGKAIFPLVRYFRHSCCPNASYFTSKNQEMVIYAKHKITKGSKITISYIPYCTYIDLTRSKRNTFLHSEYNFKCSCKACEQNWHHFRLKTVKMLLENNPELLQEINEQYQPMLKNLKNLKEFGRGIPYFLIGELIDILKLFNEKSLIHTIEYEIFLKYLNFAYIAHYGNMAYDIPNTCSYDNCPDIFL